MCCAGLASPVYDPIAIRAMGHVHSSREAVALTPISTFFSGDYLIPKNFQTMDSCDSENGPVSAFSTIENQELPDVAEVFENIPDGNCSPTKKMCLNNRSSGTFIESDSKTPCRTVCTGELNALNEFVEAEEQCAAKAAKVISCILKVQDRTKRQRAAYEKTHDTRVEQRHVYNEAVDAVANLKASINDAAAQLDTCNPETIDGPMVMLTDLRAQIEKKMELQRDLDDKSQSDTRKRTELIEEFKKLSRKWDAVHRILNK